jgi:hypothetical protein
MLTFVFNQQVKKILAKVVITLVFKEINNDAGWYNISDEKGSFQSNFIRNLINKLCPFYKVYKFSNYFISKKNIFDAYLI